MNESLGRGKKGGDCRLNRKKNKEGYIDMTAYYGLQSQMREDADLEKAAPERALRPKRHGSTVARHSGFALGYPLASLGPHFVRRLRLRERTLERQEDLGRQAAMGLSTAIFRIKTTRAYGAGCREEDPRLLADDGDGCAYAFGRRADDLVLSRRHLHRKRLSACRLAN